MKKIIVFDVDGTLADIEHRRHWIDCRPKNWKAFFAVQHEDPPHEEIVWMAKALKDANTKIIICSGRSAEFRKVTETWLLEQGVSFDEVFMRHIGDHRPDYAVKVELLEEIREKYQPKRERRIRFTEQYCDAENLELLFKEISKKPKQEEEKNK